MTCRLWRFMTSQWRHKAAILNFEPPSWIPSMQSHSWQWRQRKIYEFVLRNILNQNKHEKVKDYLLFLNEGEKTQKNSRRNRVNFRLIQCGIIRQRGRSSPPFHSQSGKNTIRQPRFTLCNFPSKFDPKWKFLRLIHTFKPHADEHIFYEKFSLTVNVGGKIFFDLVPAMTFGLGNSR